MGCGACVPRPVVSNKAQQMPSASRRKPTPVDSSLPSQSAKPRESELQGKSPTIQKPPKPQSVQPKPQVLVWPLPAQEVEPEFRLTLGQDLKPDSLFRSHDTKSSAQVKHVIPPKPSRSEQTQKRTSTKIDRHQKETNSTEWEKDNSSTYDSAHVHSVLQTTSHSCINLSTSEQTDELMSQLSRAHADLDDVVKRRLEFITVETDRTLGRLVVDTQQEQQRLLQYAKLRQTRQDELYREWLQMYIVELDQWKSRELARLQETLRCYQTQISKLSQSTITNVNEQAKLTKTRILQDEQANAEKVIADLVAEIQSFSTHHSLQHLGSETRTNINLTIHANVGTKAPGQGCKFLVPPEQVTYTD